MPGVPLYRRRMRGTSHSVEMQYEQADQKDEVEDLMTLLRHVKKRHPEVQVAETLSFPCVSFIVLQKKTKKQKAVCSGAILSNYQRLRVEHVCSRLDLASLAFLWERDQGALLDSMIASGVVAMLVKVAAMGLLPAKHLGLSLSEMRDTMHKLATAYGCSVCGEGGEYESLVLDCPLFVHRLELLETTKVTLGSDPIAPVGLLRVVRARVVNKTDGSEVSERPPVVYVEEEQEQQKEESAEEEDCASLGEEEYFEETCTAGSLRFSVLEGASAVRLSRAVARLNPLFVAVFVSDMAAFAEWNRM
jgi:diphthine-ammonia ligase